MASFDIKDFDFATFLKDISNQYIDELQDNVRYDDVIAGIANMFSTLYKRVQEISILNTLSLQSDRDFNKYIDGNMRTLDDVTKPYKDVLLEQISVYLNTDHFKDTVAKLMRLWQVRDTDGGLLGPNGENLETFIEQHIVPSFRFFTMNSGDLHKSKGISILLKRLFEFYGQVDEYDPSFEKIDERDFDDTRGNRFRKFTSLREGITLDSLLKNYSSISIFLNTNLQITNVVELATHRFVVADGYLFISRRDREDWHIINIVDEVYRLGDVALVIKTYKNIYIYRDSLTLYDATTNEFVLPVVDAEISDTSVEFIPKVANIYDKFDEYHGNNFYYITQTFDNTYIYKPGYISYSLKRIKYRSSINQIQIETIQASMGISFLDLFYQPLGVYPRVNQIQAIDYIWLDFHDDDAETFQFYPSDSYPESLECVKMIYTFRVDLQIKTQNYDGSFSYPRKNFVCVTRDGYDYDHLLPGDINNFYYQIITDIDTNVSSKYMLVQRNMSEIFRSELDKMIGDEIYSRSVLDLFIPKTDIIYRNNKFSYVGKWNASNTGFLPPSSTPSDGQYWVVSNDGNIELNGITEWRYGDVVVWNGLHSYWEKNNDILTIVDGESTSYNMTHQMIVVSDHEFETSSNIVTTPFERGNGLFFIRLSDILLNIENFSKLIWMDMNAFEKFGVDADVIFTYIDKTSQKYLIHSIKMNGFVRENNKIDLNLVLKNFPAEAAEPVIVKCEITDKYMVVYCEKFNNITDSRSSVIILENTNYSIPNGIRSNEIALYYDADVQMTTRARQPFFKEYTVVDGVNVTIENEEVETMKAIFQRYAPINTEKNFLTAHLDLAISTQNIVDLDMTQSINVDMGVFGTKEVREISYLNNRDNLVLSILGTSDGVNCNCDKQKTILYLTGYDVLTPFYDKSTQTVFPSLGHYPYTCCAATKVGKVNDYYSNYQDVCRFDTDYIYFTFSDGSPKTRLGRQRFYVNLFDKYQSVEVIDADMPLNFCWSINTTIEVLNDDVYATLGTDWFVLYEEEVYKPIVRNGECSPIGILYTYNDNPGYLSTIPDPWDIFNIPAVDVKTTYDCSYIPWTPDIADYVSDSLVPVAPMEDDYDPTRVEYVAENTVTVKIYRKNSWLAGYEINGTIVAGDVSVPVTINLDRGYTPDITKDENDYVEVDYNFTIGETLSLLGTEMVYNTRAGNLENPHIGRIQIYVANALEFDSGYKNGIVNIKFQ